jgi:hypothetical protein
MPDFVAFFPSTEAAQPPTSFSALERTFRGPLRADDVRTDVLCSATLLRTRSAGFSPRFYAPNDGAGCIVLKGQIFDVRSETPFVDLEELLQRFLAEDLADLNRYEGTFALAAWDARKRQGWALNDQTSMLNLYYGEYEGGLYVSTNAISLARALGLGLDPYGVQELLARNALLAPTTMFAGLRRMDVGEHVRYRAGTLAHGEHWNKYEPEADYRSVREAAEAAASAVVDRVARYAAVAGRVVCDLTGGLDSRLTASAAEAAGLKPAVTVNGPVDREDVRIAHQLAGAMQWEMKYFDTPLLWRAEITPDMRQELLYRTNGELPFTEAYHHLLSRPQLAQEFDLHLTGGGGELLRYFPWGQEFFGIGRRRLASVNRLLDYRFLDVAPPPSLFSQNWLPALRSRLGARIEAICREQPGTRTTQQLDAVYVWKRTNHESLYMSSVYDWLPSVAPLLSAGVVKVAISMPWKMRLTSQLQRRMIYATSSRAAGAAATVYGATAEPTSFKNVHLSAWQSAKRAAHLFDKLDRIVLRGTLTKRSPSRRAALEEHKLFLMDQAERLLAPKSMLSRALYTPEELHRMSSGSDQDRQARYWVIMRLATVEALCREMDFEPEEDFLSTAPMEQAVVHR